MSFLGLIQSRLLIGEVQFYLREPGGRLPVANHDKEGKAHRKSILRFCPPVGLFLRLLLHK